MMNKYWLYVIGFLMLLGCGKNSASGHYADSDDSSSKDTTPAAGAGIPVNYNLFIENSLSMNGYVADTTAFKNVLIKFISDIPTYLNANTQLFFINDTTCQPKTDKLDYFIENLNPANLQQACPLNTKETQIDRIIDLCTTHLDSNVNIVVSDCIFSKRNVSPVVAEADLKMFTARKLEHTNLSTIVLKYNSAFSGTYYAESENDRRISVPQKINRPFYILIFGTAKNLQPLLSKINLHYQGFEASYCLVPNKNAAKINAAVTTENKIGNFSFQKPASSMVIYDASPNSNGVFQFSINADLSNVSVEKDFLLHPSNYMVNGNFKVIAVTPIAGQSNYTHTLTLMTTNLQQNEDIQVGLKYAPPEWVGKTGSMVDNNPTDTAQQHQTYGFQYLMNGISDGYKAKNGALQFAIPVKISKGNINGANNTSGFPWWILITVVAVVGIIIWLKNKS